MTFKIIQKHPRKKKFLNIFLISGLLISVIIFVVNEKRYQNDMVEKNTMYVFLIFTIIYFIKILVEYRSKEPIKGEIIGNLIFKSDCILYADKKIDLKLLKKIHFALIDFEYKINHHVYQTWDFYYSSGANNFIELEYLNGDNEKIFFLRKNENDLLKIRNQLIQYYINGLLPFLKLIELLKIEDYNEIQEFKKTIANTV